MHLKKLLQSVFISCIIGSALTAQPIQVTVVVPNPPPVYWEEFLEFDSEIQVILINTSQQTHEIKLIPRLTGDNGISAEFQADFQPVNPIVMTPGLTLRLTYKDLQAIMGTPMESDIALSGTSWDRLHESETIPEGTYTLCVQAFDILNDRPLSNNFGCAVFFVQQYPPPYIINPYDGVEIPVTEPQFINFLWSATGIPGRTRYRFSLYDLDELGLRNPSDVLLFPGIQPLYEGIDLVTNVLPYDLSFPQLMAGRRYAVQVTAYDPFNQLLFAQGGQSELHQFIYKKPHIPDIPDVIVTVDEEDDPGFPDNFQNDNQSEPQLIMGNACNPIDLPDNQQANSNMLGPGAEVQVGPFVMEILSGGGVSPISGVGRIEIPALQASVEVAFDNLDVNTSNEMFESDDVLRAVDGSGLIPSTLLSEISMDNFNPDDLSETLSQQIADHIGNNNQWLSQGDNGNNARQLPFGFESGGMELIFTGMEFGPQGALLSVVAKVDLPEAQGNRSLLFVGKNICLDTEELGINADLTLGNDQTFALGYGSELIFHGGDNQTKIQWNENGINQFAIDGALAFDNSLVSTSGGPLRASFATAVSDYEDWTASVTLNKEEWSIPGLENFKLVLDEEQIVYDHSYSGSVNGFNLPEDHPMTGNEDLWQGVYIPGLDFEFPSGIDAAVSIQDILLESEGLWMDVTADGDLLSIDEGSAGGWPFGITGLTLDVRASSIESAHFDGLLRLPISNETLAFTVPIGPGESWHFALDEGSALDVDMWVAQIELLGNSSVTIAPDGEHWIPTAELHGSISIGWNQGDNLDDSAVKDFSLPGLDFENFIITTEDGSPSIESGTFGLDIEDQPQGALANFPLQFITDDPDHAPLELDFSEDNKIGLRLNIGLKLTEIANGFDGNTAFTLYGKWNDGQNRFIYDRTQINAVGIHANMGVLSLDGNVDFYSGDETYGDGFASDIEININPINFNTQMQLQVGRMLSPEAYRYFMIDVLVRLPDPGIQLGATPLSIYGFGGGFFLNMDRQIDLDEPLTINDVPDTADFGSGLGEGGSGAVYVPDNDRFGFNAKVIVGLSGTQRAMNADFEFGMEINQQFGVSQMWMEGNVYIMQNMADREGAGLIHGSGLLDLNFEDQEYLMASNLSMDLAGFVSANIPFEMFYSSNPDNINNPWHVYMGAWTPDADPLNDDARFQIASEFDFILGKVSSGINGYMMLGNDLPNGLPRLPQPVENLFEEKGLATPQNGPLPGQTITGFAFGLATYFDLDFKAAIFNFDMEHILGGDLILKDLNGKQCSQNNFGLNQWYANGQAYAYLGIAGSVEGKLFGKKRKFTFASIDAAAVLKFAGPKPTWIKGQAAIKGEALNGVIKFNTSVQFEHGEQVVCAGGGGGIFDDIPIVSDFDPADGAEGQSIFTSPQVAFNFPAGPFAIEEPGEGLDDPVITRYYGYEIESFKVWTKRKGQSGYSLHPGGVGNPIYEEDGYSCIYDLPEQLPEFCHVRMEIKVRGVRYTNANGNNIEEEYDGQAYETTFKVAAAPDFVLPGSIHDGRPFPLQKYYLEGESQAGYISFWHEQANDLFRSSPKSTDGLDQSGGYKYRIRFIDLAAETFKDVAPSQMSTAAGGNINFNVPNGFLKPETIYELQIARIYQPPGGQQSSTNTKVEMVALSIDNGGGSGGGGPESLSFNVIPQQQSQGGQSGLQGIGFVGNSGQQGMGNAGSFAGNAPPPPNPGASFADPNGGANSGLGGPNQWLNPGGSLGGIERESRQLLERRRVTEPVTKMLLKKPIYFRTSKYKNKANKLAGVQVHQPSKTPQREYLIDADDLYGYGDAAAQKYLNLPYILLESEEGFDRFETQYWKLKYQVKDGPYVNTQNNATVYKPDFEFEGRQDWASENFYSTQGLYKLPLDNSDNAWCGESFYHPDKPNEHIDGPLAGYNGLNAPLHPFGNHTWFCYQYAGPGGTYESLLDQRRFRNDGPFGRRLGRKFGTPAPAIYDYQYPTVEFTQWSKSGNVPPGLSGVSVQNTDTRLTSAEVNQVKPPGPPPQGNPPSGMDGFSAGTRTTHSAGGGTMSFAIQGGSVVSNGSSGTGNSGNHGVPGGLQLTGNAGFIALTDFAEWVTFKDYTLFRQALDDGITELMIESETDANGPDASNVDCADDLGPLPNEPGFEGMNGQQFGASYNFYLHYYLPVRAYFKNWKNIDYFPYPARPDGEDFFRLEGKNFSYQAPKIN